MVDPLFTCGEKRVKKKRPKPSFPLAEERVNDPPAGGDVRVSKLRERY
jgi:hypothetical protein